MGYLKFFHENESLEGLRDNIELGLLTTAAKALSGLFDAFKQQLEKGSPPVCDPKLFNELKDAVDGKAPKPDDTRGVPPSVPPVGWSTQKKILVFGGIGVVFVLAILIVLLVLRKPRPAIVPTA